MVTIVIPIYNNWDITHSLLLDIYKCCPPDTKIIVVDDCSTDKHVSSGLLWWKTTILRDRLTVYVNEINAGFLRSCNFGVSKADDGIVILMNNDVRIMDKDLVAKVRSALRTNSLTLVGARLLDKDTGWNTFEGVTYPYLEGWFLAFHKEDWNMLGGFDIRYIPFDFEDLDLSTKFLRSGGELVPVELDVIHLGGQSIKFSPEREEQTKKNKEKFRLKWLS